MPPTAFSLRLSFGKLRDAASAARAEAAALSPRGYGVSPTIQEAERSIIRASPAEWFTGDAEMEHSQSGLNWRSLAPTGERKSWRRSSFKGNRKTQVLPDGVTQDEITNLDRYRGKDISRRRILKNPMEY